MARGIFELSPREDYSPTSLIRRQCTTLQIKDPLLACQSSTNSQRPLSVEASMRTTNLSFRALIPAANSNEAEIASLGEGQNKRARCVRYPFTGLDIGIIAALENRSGECPSGISDYFVQILNASPKFYHGAHELHHQRSRILSTT